MPDEMKEGQPQPQQEKSSIEEFRQAGPTPEQMKSWQGPEWKSELPDIRMQLNDDLLKRLQERESYERSAQGSEYDKGRSIEAVIARHPNPETVRFVLRELQLSEETFNTNGEPDNRWDVSHRVTTLKDRANAFRVPIGEIYERGLAVPLSSDELEAVRDQRGVAIPPEVNELFLAKSKHVEGFGLDTFTVSLPQLAGYETDKDGGRTKQDYRMIPETLTYLGRDDDERLERSKEFEKLTDEVTARSLMMQLWNHHTTYYYALQELAEGHYFNTTLSSEGLGVLFNLKGLKEAASQTATGVPLESLGAKIETAMRLYYLAALCEKPGRFKSELMDSPGWTKFLFPSNTSPDVLESWIGKPSGWTPEGERWAKCEYMDINGKKVKIEKTTTLGEREEGKRGKLTQKNIFAESDTYVEKQLNEAIEEFLGGGKDASFVSKIEAETARRIAFRMFRLFLLADREGYELLIDPSKNDDTDPFRGLEIVFENAPAASDFGKLTHPDMYAGKSRRKTRDYMPPISFLHSREKYPRFMVDFLRHASAKTRIDVEIRDKNGDVVGDGSPQKKQEERSLMERWWGYKGGYKVERKDKNGNVTETVIYGYEAPRRLGDLNWLDFKDEIDISKEEAALLELPVGGYHHEAFKTLWLSGFMAGGKGRAHMIISETNHDPKNFTDLGWWRKFWKMLDVGIRPGVAVEGVFRGMTEDEVRDRVKKLKMDIVENFIAGLQSLPQWEEWEREQLKIKQYRGNKQPKEPDLIDRIFDIANEALRETFQAKGVLLRKPAYYKELLQK